MINKEKAEEFVNLENYLSWISDDITFCINDCDDKECFRNKVNIKIKDIPHSFSNFENTEFCAKINNPRTKDS